jgi:predicted metalloprotease with PDZ domain
MRNKIRLTVFSAVFLLFAGSIPGQKPQGTMGFIVSMEQPGNHTYHVIFRCEGLKGAAQEFHMPVWSPGYYGLFDFAKNVQNFRAQDGSGKELSWQKDSANGWKVQTGNAPVVQVAYDVLATSTFVANPYLGADRGFIIGTGVFLFVRGQIAHPVTVEIRLAPEWRTVATGLDPVSPTKPYIFKAPDFDVLYDSPILMGNLEALPSFKIKGVSHYFTGYRLGSNFDREQFMKNLQAVVAQGIAVVGEIPYTHYTFLGIGPGAGGIEHLNSAAVPFTGNPAFDSRAGLIRELCFLGHEYFHNFNVKRIRPIALGPFDYDKANLTRMLWVSEGFTSYYEYLIVARAGLMNQEELLDSYRKEITAYENSTGHMFQSATQSSWDTWTQGPFGGRGRGGISKTISYYNKGAALGLLLDLKIRHESRNKRSLDTVMQKLYQRYYKQLKRGWTDEEFQAVCENAAGTSLKELFDYASTTVDIDYDKYLGYAGLELEKPIELQESLLGVIAENVEGKLLISAVDGDSPAHKINLAAGDEIRSLDGAKIDAAGLNSAVAAKKPGDKIRLMIARGGGNTEVEVTLGHKMQRSYRIVPITQPDALKSAILRDWMRSR